MTGMMGGTGMTGMPDASVRKNPEPTLRPAAP